MQSIVRLGLSNAPVALRITTNKADVLQVPIRLPTFFLSGRAGRANAADEVGKSVHLLSCISLSGRTSLGIVRRDITRSRLLLIADSLALGNVLLNVRRNTIGFRLRAISVILQRVVLSRLSNLLIDLVLRRLLLLHACIELSLSCPVGAVLRIHLRSRADNSKNQACNSGASHELPP